MSTFDAPARLVCSIVTTSVPNASMPSSIVAHSVGVTTEELSTHRPDGEPWLLVWTNNRLSAFMRLLIVVSVVVETMKQIEAQLMMRNYEGFIS